jgi:hypothetical protein
LPRSHALPCLALLLAALATSGTSASPAHAAAAADIAGGESASTATDAPLRIPRFAHESVDIQVDGRLDEAIWQRIPSHDGMVVTEPETLLPPDYPTETLLLHTERGLYVGIRATQPVSSIVAQLSPRDQFLTRDGYQLVLDPGGEGRYAYWFQVNVAGSLADGTVLPERDFQRSWDGAWSGDAVASAPGWTGEMFIPWSILNMPERTADGTRRMGIHANRRIAHLEQRWSWPALPNTLPRFLSALQPIEVSGVDTRQEFALFPYVSARHDPGRDREVRAGVDAFWRPTPNLQVTATLYPDFGQVEADDVVVNLSAFETFFPEKRLFFLESQDIFVTNSRGGDGGSGGPSSLLNTRRIGTSVGSRRGSPDRPAGVRLDGFESIQPVELLGAVKATGQQGGFRYGVLGALEDDTEIAAVRAGNPISLDAAGRGFVVLRGLQEWTGESRAGIGFMTTQAEHPDRRARSHGIDAHYLGRGGRINWDAQLLASQVPGSTGFGGFVDWRYQVGRGRSHRLSFEYFDDELDINDLGFLNRNNQVGGMWNYSATATDIPGLRERGTFFFIRTNFNDDGRFIGGGAFVRRRWDFDDGSRWFVGLDYLPASWDDRNSLGNGAFRSDPRVRGEVFWNSSSARPLSFEFGLDIDEEQRDGLQRRVRGEVTLRPASRFSLRLSARHTHRDGWLLHRGGRSFTSYESEEWSPRLRIDAFLSARQQFQFALEWVGIKAFEDRFYEVPVGEGALDRVPEAAKSPTSTDFAISDVSLQARYRWEIAPLSDLFVVYNRGGRDPDAMLDGFGSLFTDALSDPFAESLVVKLRYRFGI